MFPEVIMNDTPTVNPSDPPEGSADTLSGLPDWFTKGEIIPLDDQTALVVRHETMRSITGVLRDIAETPGPVLLTGETGVGKSLLCRFIHANQDPYASFVSITTAGLDATFLAGRIFGDGSPKDSGQPLLAEAAGGTLVLEEMGDLPRSIQERLLADWNAPHTAKAPGPRQWICTTNLSRRALLAPGAMVPGFLERFRHVHVPPLRERKQDIPAMVAYFSRLKSSKEASLRSLEALANRLARHNFPGNVRELESIVSLEASGMPWQWQIVGSGKIP
jgi:DNA-binding NtrC family response regulator